MKRHIHFSKIYFLAIVMLAGACKQPYKPLAVVKDNRFLVVEGYINTSGTTTIKLSRTVRLADSARILPERGAVVTAEGENNRIYRLQEAGNGNYVSSQVYFSDRSICRLRIKTQSGKEYLTDDVLVKTTPAIDSIHWEKTTDGVHTYVNAHDESNNTRYYLWEYQEDWIFHSKYPSYIEYINGRFVDRDPNINIFTCWSSERSTRIIAGTSANLGNDIIYRLPIVYIPNGSWKLSDKYGLLVKQYALTKEGFEFWQNIKRNSEQLGTIFDPLPSQTSGNLHCLTSPEETVIGFISAGTTIEKRIFITRFEVSPWLYDDGCEEKFVTPDSVAFYFASLLYAPEYSQFMPPGYPSSTLNCLDCRLRGTNIKPSFWP